MKGNDASVIEGYVNPGGKIDADRRSNGFIDIGYLCSLFFHFVEKVKKEQKIFLGGQEIPSTVDIRQHTRSPKTVFVICRRLLPYRKCVIDWIRNKCGIWGWRSDKTEVVNGRESKVYSATNVELVTKTRVEHLSHEDRTANRRYPQSWH